MIGYNSTQQKSFNIIHNLNLSLNRKGIPNNIVWEIVTRAPTYSPVTKSFRLCLMEKFYIMYESSKATLNVKSEFFSGCLHKKKLLLKNERNRKPG